MSEVKASKMLAILEKMVGSRDPQLVVGNTTFLTPAEAASLMGRVARVRSWNADQKVQWFAAIDVCTDWSMGYPPGVRQIVIRTKGNDGTVRFQFVDLDERHGESVKDIAFKLPTRINVRWPKIPRWVTLTWQICMLFAAIVSLPWLFRPLPHFLNKAFIECLRRLFGMLFRVLGGPVTVVIVFFQYFTFLPRQFKLPPP